MMSILASHPCTWSLGGHEHLLKGNYSKVQYLGDYGPECPSKHFDYFRSQYVISASSGGAGKRWPIFCSKLDYGIDPAEFKDDHDKDEPLVGETGVENLKCSVKRNSSRSLQSTRFYSFCVLGVGIFPGIEFPPLSTASSVAKILKVEGLEASSDISEFILRLVVMDLDPATAKLAIGLLGPFFSAFGFLFIVRIIMSWYPKLPVGKFPYVIAYAPTEPLLIPTRKLIPPLGGVDVTPVVWFGLISFLSEILVGPQGLLVLLSQQV